jgi:DNA polymerase-3 subunit beta
MKFTINQSVLSEVLVQVSKAVPVKATHPVLTCFRIEAEASQGALAVTGFDLAMGVKTELSANVIRGGTAAIPAKLLLDIVSRLPQGELTLETDSEFLSVLTSSSGSYEVRGMNPKEYPDLPEISATQQIKFDPQTLVDGIKNTLFAVSPDEAKQVLHGVHFKIQGKILDLAATDGHRLSVVSIASEDLTEDSVFSATIPLRVMRELEKLLQRRTEPVAIHFSSEQVFVEIKNEDRKTRLTGRTLSGEYPRYRELIPPVFKLKLIVDRKSLLGSIERISVFAADKKDFACVFAVSEADQRIALSTETQEIGHGREAIDVQVVGTDTTFAFNIRYLLDILRTAQSNEIVLHANNPLSPVVFRPVGADGTIFLMMPKQLSGGNNESTKAN